ncbi:dihydroneopterin aldolase [Spiribacter sp. C176]|uniref:7,8-dihydroneopterin aldolase n=1 Tax=Spiribacter salilacus TaxID=2664894 RepID=A0A6N7QPD3_9GAMM|nr:dihydroneopterin aldolase [Spiribacter salilacus]MRH78276.1 dihydroneopterin aldolase [Spiribacter salilacus]
MDTLFVQELELRAVIGVHDWERTFAQRLRVDLVLGVTTEMAAKTDDLAHAVDYAALAERLQALAAQSACELIETLAARLADEVLEQPGVHWVRLTLHKPGALPAAKSVGITIERPIEHSAGEVAS